MRLTDAPDARRVLRRAWPLARPHRWWFGAAIAASLVATALELAGPVLVGHGVDAVVRGDRDALARSALLLAAVAIGSWAAEQARRRLAAAAGERFLADLRGSVTAALLREPLDEIESVHPGELLARGTSDVAAVSGFVRDGARNLVDTLLLLAVTAVVLVGTAWQVALVAVAYVPGLVVALRRYRREATTAYAAFDQRHAEVTAAVGETLAGREALQAAGAERRWLARLAAVDATMARTYDDSLRADNRLSVLGLWQSVTLAAVLLVGGLVELPVGAVATGLLAVRQLFRPLDSLLWLYGEARSAGANLARILELTGPLPVPAPAAAPPPRVAAPLALRGVAYAYPGAERPALTGVDLTIDPGEHVAVVGPSGAGKSTLARLLAGLTGPAAGELQVPPGVVFVPQDGHVVAGTLADNLRLVPGDHGDVALAAALATVGLPGPDTPVADRGVDLSAGERQLVGLARAALADPAVIVLDEATADVDPATEARVAEALRRLGRGRTVVVVAHRPETAARCDRVLELVDGRLIVA